MIDVNCLFCGNELYAHSYRGSSGLYFLCDEPPSLCEAWVYSFTNNEIDLISFCIMNKNYLIQLSGATKESIDHFNSYLTSFSQFEKIFILDKIDKESVLSKIEYLKFLS